MTTSKILKQTKSLAKENIRKNWMIVDAENIVLGRLASAVSKILRGKHKPSYTPHVDCGDNVIVKNAEKITFNNNKLQVNLALNYGSKTELINALKLLNKSKKKINEKNFLRYLQTNEAAQ